MPAQRIVMPNGTTKYFREGTSPKIIEQAKHDMLLRMAVEGHPAANIRSPSIVVTQSAGSPNPPQSSNRGFWDDLADKGRNIIDSGIKAGTNFANSINDTNIEKVLTYGLLAPLGPVGFLKAQEWTQPHPHYFKIHDRICKKGEPGCTLQSEIDEMPNAQFPSQFREPTAPGKKETVLPFIPGPFGNVTVTKNVRKDGIPVWSNETRDGHVFEKGKISRKPSEDNQYVYMDTEGTGMNKTALRAWLNNKMGPVLFRAVDNDLRNGMRDKATGWDKMDKELSKTLYPYLHGLPW